MKVDSDKNVGDSNAVSKADSEKREAVVMEAIADHNYSMTAEGQLTQVREDRILGLNFFHSTFALGDSRIQCNGFQSLILFYLYFQ